MKLTKLQRYTAYCILQAEINGYSKEMRYDGFCNLINSLFGIQLCISNDSYWKPFRETFPEIVKRATIDIVDEAFMYKNWKERKEALKQCILETHP